MKHDLADEEPKIPSKGVPKSPPIGPRRHGGSLNVRTVYRWAGRGACGVVLETIVKGGQRYTTGPALRRFFAAVTAAKGRKGGGEEAPTKTEGKHSPAEIVSELDKPGI